MLSEWFGRCFMSRVELDVAVVEPRDDSICVVWDIENVAPPLPPASMLKTLLALAESKSESKSESTSNNKTPPSIVCCVTALSLRRIEKDFPEFMRDVVTMMDVRIASLVPKRGADYVLNLEIMRFCTRDIARRKRLVLLTGDADFLGPVQVALENGVDVQLIYLKESCSRVLLDLAWKSKPIEYMDFLRSVHGDKTRIVLAGSSKKTLQIHGVLRDHCKFGNGWIGNHFKKRDPIIAKNNNTARTSLNKYSDLKKI